MESSALLAHIPLSESDKLLHSWGFDLTKEYFEIISRFSTSQHFVVDLATGTGRMSAVLSTMFPQVVTGDISLQDHRRAVQRVPISRADVVHYLQLNMEELPFPSHSLPSIVCMNTLHEVENPKQCLQEMMRVIASDGILIVGDFNRTGFDTMQRIHEIVYHNNHSEGNISSEEIETELHQIFQSIEIFNTALNRTFFATRKHL